MAKKIKFPLKLKNDFPARTLEELKQHFDLDKIVTYFLDGKLLTWLESRYYDIEAKAVRELRKNEEQLPQKLSQIFSIANSEFDEHIDLESVEERNRKLGILRQYTSDPVVLEQVASVAFNQEDLGDLLDEGVQEIYLCNNSFTIPLSVENKIYVGIGNVEVVIRSEEHVDFKAKNIEFQNVHFNETYEKLLQKQNYSPEVLYQKAVEAEKNKDYSLAFSLYQQAADKNYSKAYFKLGWFYNNGLGVEQSYIDSHDWYIKSANSGDTNAMNNLSVLYFQGQGIPQNRSKGQEWLQKAVDNGDSFSTYWLGRYYFWGQNGYNKDLNYGKSLIEKAANNGCVDAMVCLGELYRYNQPFYVSAEESYKWYKKAADLGNAEAMYQLSCYYLTQEKSTDAEKKQWLEQAANFGHFKAINSLVNRLIYGTGIFPTNIKLAWQWFKKILYTQRAITDLRKIPPNMKERSPLSEYWSDSSENAVAFCEYFPEARIEILKLADEYNLNGLRSLINHL